MIRFSLFIDVTNGKRVNISETDAKFNRFAKFRMLIRLMIKKDGLSIKEKKYLCK